MRITPHAAKMHDCFNPSTAQHVTGWSCQAECSIRCITCSLPPFWAYHCLHRNKRKLFAARRHGRSLCIQKQPETAALKAAIRKSDPMGDQPAAYIPLLADNKGRKKHLNEAVATIIAETASLQQHSMLTVCTCMMMRLRAPCRVLRTMGAACLHMLFRPFTSSTPPRPTSSSRSYPLPAYLHHLCFSGHHKCCHRSLSPQQNGKEF